MLIEGISRTKLVHSVFYGLSSGFLAGGLMLIQVNLIFLLKNAFFFDKRCFRG